MFEYIGREFQSIRKNVIYKIIGYDSRNGEFQCEYRLMGSMRIRVSMINQEVLLNKNDFREL